MFEYFDLFYILITILFFFSNFSTIVKTKRKLVDRISKKTEIVLLEITIRPQDPNWVTPDSGQLYLCLATTFYLFTHINKFETNRLGILQYDVMNKISIR